MGGPCDIDLCLKLLETNVGPFKTLDCDNCKPTAPMKEAKCIGVDIGGEWDYTDGKGTTNSEGLDGSSFGFGMNFGSLVIDPQDFQKWDFGDWDFGKWEDFGKWDVAQAVSGESNLDYGSIFGEWDYGNLFSDWDYSKGSQEKWDNKLGYGIPTLMAGF